MARERKELHKLLEQVLTDCGVENADRHVYFQRPSNIQMEYPAILYSINTPDENFANNKPYISYNVYSLTVIDWNPDSPIPEAIRDSFGYRYCSIGRRYPADGLNHTSMTIYF